VTCRNQIVEPLFRPAAEIIDWSLLGQRIGDRAKPLAAKTLGRIQAGIDRYWAPLLVPVEGRDGKSAAPVDQAARTMTTRNETGMAFLTQFRDRVRDLDPEREPLTTVVADGANHGLCQAFIAELRGGGSVARPVADPLATVTASGNHHGLVTSYYGKGGTRPTSDPVPTCTTVETHALLMRNNSSKGDGAEMTTPVTEVARTITTAGHQSLLAGGPTVDINDVLFRMLEPREIARAMDFPGGYRILGNRREQVRQSGNAVTPPAARDLVGVVAESLGGA
jgi:DNA (cytosine-5)-methyltransferase 1